MTKENIKLNENDVNLLNIAKLSAPKALKFLKSSQKGLNKKQVEESRDSNGVNAITKKKKSSWVTRLIHAFINPFTLILLVLAIISLFTDVILSKDDKNPATFIIILILVLVSSFLRFIQETKSTNEAKKISSLITTTTCVLRKRVGRKEVPLKEVVVGDIICLSAGDMIPADLRLIQAKDLFIGQASLTGESEPVEKTSNQDLDAKTALEAKNLAYMGTNVISGSALGVVIAVGDNTLFGKMAKSLNKKAPKTTFEKGVNNVSWILIRFMLVMVPIVLLINGFTKGNWLEASLFAISIAVGLTPEMLPMIVTTCLAKGTVVMSKNKVIIKNINSIQDLGSIDILCTDKTGTLTQDRVVLEYHMNVMGKEDSRVLKHAFLNSYFETGLKNLIDLAIINKTNEECKTKEELISLEKKYKKVDELPFDFERRRMSVVVQDATGKTQMITKGAIEEILKCCSYVEYNGEIKPLDKDLTNIVLKKASEFSEKGMRVIAVAQKSNPSKVGDFSIKDEKDMVLIGYLAFLDPPKDTAKSAIEALLINGVNVKVLTGDNEQVTNFICNEVGLKVNKILLGSDVENMSSEEIHKAVEESNVFAKLSPQQKAKIVTALRDNGHTVGYMGDGINDTMAMKAADVGISVDSAVDIAKETAGIILLEKDLMVLEKGIIEGRKTYVNMIKYIKMTASSNFGNMLSVLVASAFLPFLPMQPIHILILNLIYDISCVGIPWDNVDSEYLKTPQKWVTKGITSFMFSFGPVSSVFDIMTYILMYFLICPTMVGNSFVKLSGSGDISLFTSLFQTGWFIESMLTQALVIHFLRTEKIPFIQSRASIQLMVLTALGIGVSIIIPYTPFARYVGLSGLSWLYYGCLAAVFILYILLISLVKKIYIKKVGRLL
jgi:Mg2+-importing ATPase